MELSATDKPRILCVDDEEVIRTLLTALFQRDGRFRIDTAADGVEALEAVARNDYAVVITDLQMPNLAGLPFIRKLRRTHPNLPFMVFTGFGEVEDAIQALRLGALNFFRKPTDLHQIIPAVEKAIELVQLTARRQRFFALIDSMEMDLTLEPRLADKEVVLQHLIDPLVPMGLTGETDVKNVFLALDEVANNAIIYGALGIDSSLREGEDGFRHFHRAVRAREEDPSYSSRKVRIHAAYSPHRAIFRITDPGEGFDYARLPDPTLPENLMKEHGRGLLLVSCFVDVVQFNDKGNEVTLIKNRELPPEEE